MIPIFIPNEQYGASGFTVPSVPQVNSSRIKYDKEVKLAFVESGNVESGEVNIVIVLVNSSLVTILPSVTVLRIVKFDFEFRLQSVDDRQTP